MNIRISRRFNHQFSNDSTISDRNNRPLTHREKFRTLKTAVVKTNLRLSMRDKTCRSDKFDFGEFYVIINDFYSEIVIAPAFDQSVRNFDVFVQTKKLCRI